MATAGVGQAQVEAEARQLEVVPVPAKEEADQVVEKVKVAELAMVAREPVVEAVDQAAAVKGQAREEVAVMDQVGRGAAHPAAAVAKAIPGGAAALSKTP